MASLEIITGERAGKFHKLTDEATTIGRFPSCDLVLPLHTISRKHTRISCREGAYLIEDLGSLNGTYVNGKRIDKPTELNDQDVIQLYDVVMVFHQGSEARRTALLLADSSSGSNRATLLLEDDTNRAPMPREVVQASTVGKDTKGSVGADVKLAAVMEITRFLGDSLDVEEVLPRILDALFRLFPSANRGYILLVSEQSGELTPRALKRRDLTDTFGPISRTIAERVMSQCEAILSTDVKTDEQFRDSESVHAMEVRSMMCAPLMGPAHVPLGILHIETSDPVKHFRRDDLELLVTLATVAGQAVELARSHQARLLLDRQQREMAMAQDVQRHFLPQKRPNVPGYEFFDYYHAATEVGGDYYGYVALTEGRLGLALGDVSGKGVPAALFMARLCSETRACLEASVSPGEALARLNNDVLVPILGDRFVTFVLAVLQPQRHELTIVNAGHPAPLLRRAATGEVIEIGNEEKGLPLGFGIQGPYDQATVTLEPGDMVLMYTDGICDAESVQGQRYGRGRIVEVLRDGAPRIVDAGNALLDDVERFVQGHLQSDDMCVLGLGRM